MVNLKNVEEPSHHLGGDFFRDKDGTFCHGGQTCVKRVCDNFKMMFGTPSEMRTNQDCEVTTTPRTEVRSSIRLLRLTPTVIIHIPIWVLIASQARD